MNEPRIIAVVTADWHLKRHTWSSRPEIYDDEFAALEQVVALAYHYDIPIIAAGDLFDVPSPDAMTVRMANKILNGWYPVSGADPHAAVEVFFIQGQRTHDNNGANPWLYAAGQEAEEYRHHLDPISGVSCPRIISPKTKTTDNAVVLYGRDWSPKAGLREVLDAIDPVVNGGKHVLVLHQVCLPAATDTCFERSADDTNKVSDWATLANPFRQSVSETLLAKNQLEDYMIPDWVDMVILGDTHNHNVFWLRKKNGNPVLVLSPGALTMQRTNETNCGSVFLLYDDLSFQSVRLKNRPFIQFEPKTFAELDEMIASLTPGQYLPPDVPLLLVRPHVMDRDRLTRLQQACGNPPNYHLFLLESPKATKTVDPSEPDIDIHNTKDVFDIVDSALTAVTEDDPETRRLTAALLRAESVPAALEEEWKNHLTNYQT